ncbi:MAG: hypothetical protein P9X24_10860 [Candidatus Hatepunaea meridiana]|nr:hypothetical protein [Candidatus Hatepunaea meridiana]
MSYTFKLYRFLGDRSIGVLGQNVIRHRNPWYSTDQGYLEECKSILAILTSLAGSLKNQQTLVVENL